MPTLLSIWSVKGTCPRPRSAKLKVREFPGTHLAFPVRFKIESKSVDWVDLSSSPPTTDEDRVTSFNSAIFGLGLPLTTTSPRLSVFATSSFSVTSGAAAIVVSGAPPVVPTTCSFGAPGTATAPPFCAACNFSNCALRRAFSSCKRSI